MDGARRQTTQFTFFLTSWRSDYRENGRKCKFANLRFTLLSISLRFPLFSKLFEYNPVWPRKGMKQDDMAGKTFNLKKRLIQAQAGRN